MCWPECRPVAPAAAGYKCTPTRPVRELLAEMWSTVRAPAAVAPRAATQNRSPPEHHLACLVMARQWLAQAITGVKPASPPPARGTTLLEQPAAY